MNIVVNDANILIDLVKLQLLPQFFTLEHLFYTTDMILEELHQEQQEEIKVYIETERLQVLEFKEEELIQIVELQTEKPQLSEQDCSAVVCARKVNGELLTSDNTLRRFAVSRNMIVRGHLWLLDQIVAHGIITGNQAIEKLKMLIEEVNPRLGLPIRECEARFAIWRGLK